MHKTEHLLLVVVVGLDNGSDERVVCDAENVVLPLKKLLKALLKHNLLQHEVHLVVVVLLYDVHRTDRASSNLCTLKVHLLDILRTQHAVDFEFPVYFPLPLFHYCFRLIERVQACKRSVESLLMPPLNCSFQRVIAANLMHPLDLVLPF